MPAAVRTLSVLSRLHAPRDPKLEGAMHEARKAGELRLQTAHPAELLEEMFAGASDAVREVDAIHRDAAKLLQTGDGKQGYARLLEALAVWAPSRPD